MHVPLPDRPSAQEPYTHAGQAVQLGPKNPLAHRSHRAPADPGAHVHAPVPLHPEEQLPLPVTQVHAVSAGPHRSAGKGVNTTVKSSGTTNSAASTPEREVKLTVKFVIGVPEREGGIENVTLALAGATAAGNSTDPRWMSELGLPPTCE